LMFSEAVEIVHLSPKKGVFSFILN
jgi:hypothetical protein